LFAEVKGIPRTIAPNLNPVCNSPLRYQKYLEPFTRSLLVRSLYNDDVVLLPDRNQENGIWPVPD